MSSDVNVPSIGSVINVPESVYTRVSLERLAGDFVKGRSYVKIIPPPQFHANAVEEAFQRYGDVNAAREGYGIETVNSFYVSHIGDGYYGFHDAKTVLKNPFDFTRSDTNATIQEYKQQISRQNLRHLPGSNTVWTQYAMSSSVFDNIDESHSGIKNDWNPAKMITPFASKSSMVLTSGHFISPYIVEPLDMPRISYLMPGSNDKLWVIIPRRQQNGLFMRLFHLRNHCVSPMLHRTYGAEMELLNSLGLDVQFVMQKPNEFMVIPPGTCYQTVSLWPTAAAEVHFYCETFIPTMMERKRCTCPIVLQRYQNVLPGIIEYRYGLEENIMKAFHGPEIQLRPEFLLKRVREIEATTPRIPPILTDDDIRITGTYSGIEIQDIGDVINSYPNGSHASANISTAKRRLDFVDNDPLAEGQDPLQMATDNGNVSEMDETDKSFAPGTTTVNQILDGTRSRFSFNCNDSTTVNENLNADNVMRSRFSFNGNDSSGGSNNGNSGIGGNKVPTSPEMDNQNMRHSSTNVGIDVENATTSAALTLCNGDDAADQLAGDIGDTSEQYNGLNARQIVDRFRQKVIDNGPSDIPCNDHPSRPGGASSSSESDDYSNGNRQRGKTSKRSSIHRNSNSNRKRIRREPENHNKSDAPNIDETSQSHFVNPSVSTNSQSVPQIASTNSQSVPQIASTNSQSVPQIASTNSQSVPQIASTNSPHANGYRDNPGCANRTSKDNITSPHVQLPSDSRSKVQTTALLNPISTQPSHASSLNPNPGNDDTTTSKSPDETEINGLPNNNKKNDVKIIGNIVEDNSEEIVENIGMGIGTEDTQTLAEGLDTVEKVLDIPALNEHEHEVTKNLLKKIDCQMKYKQLPPEKKNFKGRQHDVNRRRYTKEPYSKWFEDRLAVIRTHYNRWKKALDDYENGKIPYSTYGTIENVRATIQKDIDTKEALLRRRDLANILKAMTCKDRPILVQTFYVGLTPEQIIRNFINQKSAVDRFMFSLAVIFAVKSDEMREFYRDLINDEQKWNEYFGVVLDEDNRVPWEEWDLRPTNVEISKAIATREKRPSQPDSEASFDTDFITQTFQRTSAKRSRLETNQDGNLNAESQDGNSNAESQDGNLNAESQEGNLNAESQDGNLNAESQEGNLNAESQDGNLNAESQDGNLNAESQDGNLNAESQDGNLSIISHVNAQISQESSQHLMGSQSNLDAILAIPSRSDTPEWRKSPLKYIEPVQEERMQAAQRPFDSMRNPENISYDADDFFLNNPHIVPVKSRSRQTESDDQVDHVDVLMDTDARELGIVQTVYTHSNFTVTLSEDPDIDAIRTAKAQKKREAYAKVVKTPVMAFIRSVFKGFGFDIKKVEMDRNYGMNDIVGRYLSRLAPTNFLSNHVVDEYFDILAHHYPNCAFGNTNIMVNPTAEAEKDKDNCKTATIFLASILKDQHFILYIADIELKRCYCYDPLYIPQFGLQNFRREIDNLTEYVSIRFDVSLEEYPTVTIPRQENTCDCGVLVIFKALHLLQGQPSEDVPKYARSLITAELLYGELHNPIQRNPTAADEMDEEDIQIQKREDCLNLVDCDSIPVFIDSTAEAFNFFARNQGQHDAIGSNNLIYVHLAAIHMGRPMSTSTIDVYFEMIQARSEQCNWLPKVQTAGHHICTSYSFANVTKQGPNPDLFLAPIMKNQHYLLYVADLKEGSFQIYYPLQDATIDFYDYFGLEISNLNLYVETRYESTLRDSQPSVTHETGDHDKSDECIFVCTRAEQLSRGVNTFDLPEFARPLIVAELLYGSMFPMVPVVIVPEVVATVTPRVSISSVSPAESVSTVTVNHSINGDHASMRDNVDEIVCSCKNPKGKGDCEAYNFYADAGFRTFIDEAIENLEKNPDVIISGTLKCDITNFLRGFTNEFVLISYFKLINRRVPPLHTCLIGNPHWGTEAFNQSQIDRFKPVASRNLWYRRSPDENWLVSFDHIYVYLMIPTTPRDANGKVLTRHDAIVAGVKPVYHVVLFCCDTVRKHIFVYDPLGYDQNGHHKYRHTKIRKQIENAVPWMKYHLSKLEQFPVAWEDLKFSVPENVTTPIVKKVKDTSVCVCTFAEQYSSDAEHITIQDIELRRKSISAELTEGRLYHEARSLY